MLKRPQNHLVSLSLSSAAMEKPAAHQPQQIERTLTREERQSLLVFCCSAAFIFGVLSLGPPARYMAAADDKAAAALILLPDDCWISMGFTLTLSIFRTVLPRRLTVDLLLFCAVARFTYVSFMTVSYLNVAVRLAVAVVTTVVFWVCELGELPEA